MTRYLLAVNLGIVLGALTGCGVGADVLQSIRTTNEAIVLAEPFVEAAYQAELARCVQTAATEKLGNECIDAAEKRWRVFVDVMADVRAVRCKLEPQKCEASR